MAYIMNDDKGYIEFHKDPNNKKKFKYYKNKIKMTKISRRRNRNKKR